MNMAIKGTHYEVYDAGYGWVWECMIDEASAVDLFCCTYFDEEEDAKKEAEQLIGDWLSAKATAEDLSDC